MADWNVNDARVAAFDAVNRRFASGNNTPVESARITREEFMEIAGVIEDAKREAMRAQAGEAIASKYNDCECGDLMASGEFVCDNCMAAYKAGILPSGHVIISADEYDFLRKQACTTHPTDSGKGG